MSYSKRLLDEMDREDGTWVPTNTDLADMERLNHECQNSLIEEIEMSVVLVDN